MKFYRCMGNVRAHGPNDKKCSECTPITAEEWIQGREQALQSELDATLSFFLHDVRRVIRAMSEESDV